MSVVKEGSEVYIYCSWKATTKEDVYNVAKEIKFTNAISIDGKQLATVDDRVTPGQYGGIYKENLHVKSIAKKWKAAGPGKHTIQCQLDLSDQFKEKPGWKQDSQRTIQLVVRRDLKEGEPPAPIMLNPPAGAQYQRGDNIKIPIGFRVDDAFLKLSHDLIIPMVWFRMELEYDGPPGARREQKKMVALSGQPFGGGTTLIKNNPVEDFLTMQEMKKQGVGEEGHYTVTVYLSVGGKNGPKARRSFNIHGPLGVKGKTGAEAQGVVSPPASSPKLPVQPPKIPPQPPKAR